MRCDSTSLRFSVSSSLVASVCLVLILVYFLLPLFLTSALSSFVSFSLMRSLSLTSSLSSSSLSPNFLASLSTLVYFCPSSHSSSLDADPTKLRFEVGDKVRLLGKAVGTGPNAGQKKKTYLLGIVVDRCVEVNIIKRSDDVKSTATSVFFFSNVM